MPKTRTIRFTADYAVRDHVDPALRTRYAKGQTVEVGEASAQHFVNRNVAEFVERPAKAEPADHPKDERNAPPPDGGGKK
jgi:hypothetical protein